MSNHIDREKFIELLVNRDLREISTKTIGECLDKAEVADVVEVRHGHWERDGHHIRCSECGTYFCITDREGDSFPINYCPCCGAKMG